MKLFMCHTGPLLQYDGEFLHIADLNPEMSTRWRMTRGEMWRLGWRCIAAAIRARAAEGAKAEPESATP